MKRLAARTSPLLVTEDQYLPALLPLLDSAKKSIDVIAYSFAIGSAAGVLASAGAPYRVAQKLVELKAARPRLRIRVYLEGTRDTEIRNRVTARFLKRGGVDVKFGATHAKGFAIDGRYVLFGSTNLTNQSMVKNNETNLVLADAAAVREFGRYFEHLWGGGRHGGIELGAPLLADGAFEGALLEVIAAARKTIEFSIYFFHHSQIENAIIAAHRRGVQVRGLVHRHFSFALSYVRRTCGTAERLRAAGIEDLSFGPPHLFTHSKYLIRDRRELILGTGNWLHEDVEVHPQLYIRLVNPKLATQLAKHLADQRASLD